MLRTEGKPLELAVEYEPAVLLEAGNLVADWGLRVTADQLSLVRKCCAVANAVEARTETHVLIRADKLDELNRAIARLYPGMKRIAHHSEDKPCSDSIPT